MRNTFLVLTVLFGMFLVFSWGRDRWQQRRADQAQTCWRLRGPEIKAVEECLVFEYDWHQADASSEARRRDNDRRDGRGR
jgi:hypothetical protein